MSKHKKAQRRIRKTRTGQRPINVFIAFCVIILLATFIFMFAQYFSVNPEQTVYGASTFNASISPAVQNPDLDAISNDLNNTDLNSVPNATNVSPQ